MRIQQNKTATTATAPVLMGKQKRTGRFAECYASHSGCQGTKPLHRIVCTNNRLVVVACRRPSKADGFAACSQEEAPNSSGNIKLAKHFKRLDEMVKRQLPRTRGSIDVVQLNGVLELQLSVHDFSHGAPYSILAHVSNILRYVDTRTQRIEQSRLSSHEVTNPVPSDTVLLRIAQRLACQRPEQAVSVPAFHDDLKPHAVKQGTN